MAKSRKKSSGSSESNPKVAIGVLGGLVVAGAAYVFIKGGAQAPVPQGPPAPPVVPQVAVAPAVPEGQNGGPVAVPIPAPAGGTLVPKSPETSTPNPAAAPAVGQLLPKATTPTIAAGDAPASSTGRVRPKRRPADQVQVTTQVDEDLDAEPRGAELSGYADSLKLTGVGYNAEKIDEWAVQADPLPEGLPENKQAAKLKAKINAWGSDWGGKHVLFPVVPSPFVIVGGNRSRGDYREIFSLDSAKGTSQIKGIQFDPTLQALSPDGKFYAAVLEGKPQWVEIWDVQKKSSLEHVPAVPEDQVDEPKAPAPVAPQPMPMDDAIRIGKPRPTPSVPAFRQQTRVPEELKPRFLGFPRADRLIVASDSRIQVWSIPDRAPIADYEVPTGFEGEGGQRRRAFWDHDNAVANMAISPGGTYAALVQEGDANFYALDVFTLEDGKSVGRFDVSRRKEGFFTRSEFHGLAFSPDGKELAALFETDKNCRILIWDLASGKIVDWVHFGLDQKPAWGGRNYVPLTWFPSGNRFLIDGKHIIDRQADAWLYSLPDSRGTSRQSRQVVREDTITVVDDDDSRVTGLVGYQLDTETLDRAVELIVEGGSAIDSVLPPITRVDTAAIVDKTEQAEVPWSVEADPAPKLKEGLGDASAKVPEIAPLTQVLNSRVEGARAFFGFANAFNSDLKKNPRRIEVVDLAKKKALKPVAVDYPFELFAASPLGRRIALRPAARKPTGRIEIYDADAGTPLCSWRPEGAEIPEGKRKDLHSAMFVDEDHLATLSDEGRFVMWEIPACKPLFARDLSLMIHPTVSPGGKYLAFVYDDAVEICDARTGDLQGEFLTGNPAVGVAFHPDGKRVAVLLEATGNRFVAEIDLTKGTMSPTYVVPGFASDQATSRERSQERPPEEREREERARKSLPTWANRPTHVNLQWCENDRLLIDHSQLFDFEKRRIVWTYTTKQSLFWMETGDKRLWYASPARMVWGARGRASSASRLFALAIPHDAAEEIIAENANTPVRYVLKPGGKIFLDLNLIAPSNQPDFAARVREHLVKEFAKVQVTVVDSPLSANGIQLRLAMSQGSGESMRYQGFLDGKWTQTDVATRTIALDASIISEGLTHWKCRYEATNTPFSLWVGNKDGGIQGATDRHLAEGTASLPYRFRAPAYVIHQNDQNGFGTTELSDQGYVTKEAQPNVTSAP